MFARRIGFIVTKAIFVLGINSSAWALTRPPLPVILTHGWLGSADSWSGLAGFLSQNGWMGWRLIVDPTSGTLSIDPDSGQPPGPPFQGDYYRMQFSSSNNLTFEQQALELTRVINAVLSLNHTDRVILVAHSMGGLASRQYLQFHNNDDNVLALITIGTPHGGADFTALADIFQVSRFSVAVQEMKPNSEAMTKLNNNITLLPRGVLYTSIVGLGKINIITGQPGDGIVTAKSQNLANLAGTSELKHDLETITIQDREDCGFFVPPFLDEVHTCETGDRGIWFSILDSILNPQLALSLNKSSFAIGDSPVLTLTTQLGFPGEENTGDLYLVVQLPDGFAYAYDDSNWILVFDGKNFIPSPIVPFRLNKTLSSSSEAIFSGQIPPTIPPGIYNIFTLLVEPGADPFDMRNWVSNLARASFTVLAPPPPSNQPPVIGALTAVPSQVAPGGTSTLSVSAADPENDPLAYTWSATCWALSTTSGPGQIFHNLPKRVHVAKNASMTEPAKVPMFWISEKGQPLTTPVK